MDSHWTDSQPIYRQLRDKVVAMILALLVIISAIVLILYVVISSSISEGPKLVASITSGFDEIMP